MKKKKFVLAPDSFKESMTAKEVCEAMEEGFRRSRPNDEFIHVPMADGGEGTVQSLVDATGGTLYNVQVRGPLQQEVVGQYGLLGDGITGAIEMASASGIQLIKPSEKNPLVTSTYGTGQLIKECLDKGIKRLIIGIGGSATNDGGSGMAAALGVKFLDKNGNDLPLGGGYLNTLETIDMSNVDPRLSEIEILVASDVTNPLCGPLGASAVFGPQKGADKEMVALLDENLSHYAAVIKEQIGKDIKDVPGAGAAGGLGAGLLTFTHAKLEKGVDIVIEYTGLIDKVKKADYVITGEGGMDYQTQYGKTAFGVAKVAQEFNKPVIGIAGYVGEGIEELYSKGFTAIFGILPGAMDLDEALKMGKENVARTCDNIGRILP